MPWKWAAGPFTVGFRPACSGVSACGRCGPSSIKWISALREFEQRLQRSVFCCWGTKACREKIEESSSTCPGGKVKLIIPLHPTRGPSFLQGGIQGVVGYALKPWSLDATRSCGRRLRAKNRPQKCIAGSSAGLDVTACVRSGGGLWRRRLPFLQTGSCRFHRRGIRRGTVRVHSSK